MTFCQICSRSRWQQTVVGEFSSAVYMQIAMNPAFLSESLFNSVKNWFKGMLIC